MPQEKIGCAIVGCGGIHHEHAKAILGMPDVRLAAVCDIRKERADASALQYGAEACYDVREVCRRADVRIVHLCTPHYLHAPMALAAMEAGKYVLTEKPMATSVADARAMIALSDRLEGRLGVIFQNRYLPAARMLRRIVAEREMGRLIAVRGAVAWRRSPAYYADDWHGRWATEGGGVMMNQAIHTLDLMQWCAGRRAVKVSGSISTDGLRGVIEVEDTAYARIEFEDGVIGLFYATVAGGENEPAEIAALLEGGRLLYRNGWLHRWREDGELETLCRPDREKTGDKSYWGIGHRPQIEDFYGSVRSGQPIAVDGEQAIASIRIIQALYESSRTGEPRTIG